MAWTINANCSLYVYRPEGTTTDTKYIKVGIVENANFNSVWKQNQQQYNRVFRVEVHRQVGGYEESQDLDEVAEPRIEKLYLLLSEDSFADFNTHKSGILFYNHKDILQQWTDCNKYKTLHKKKGAWFTYYFQSRAPPRIEAQPSPPLGEGQGIVPQQLDFGSPSPNPSLRPYTSAASSSSRDLRPATPPIPSSQPAEQLANSSSRVDEGTYIYRCIYTYCYE